MARKSIANSPAVRGGSKVSTNEKFESEVNARKYGATTARGNLTNVAAASANNVPAAVARETNARGGRNALDLSPDGTMTAHKARYKELRAAFGLSQG